MAWHLAQHQNWARHLQRVLGMGIMGLARRSNTVMQVMIRQLSKLLGPWSGLEACAFLEATHTETCVTVGSPEAIRFRVEHIRAGDHGGELYLVVAVVTSSSGKVRHKK